MTYDPRKTDWGSDSAEADENLLRYFVKPVQLQRLKEQRKQFVVGRKGAGKSAIRKKLLADLQTSRDSINIEILPNQTIFSAIRLDEEVNQNFAEEIFFQYAWLTHCFNAALESIGAGQEGQFTVGSYVAAREFAIKRGTANLDFLEGIRDLVSRIKIKGGNKIGDLGIQIEKSLREITDINSLEFHLKKLAVDGVKVTFLIDDLDLGWDNTELSNKVLQGMLLASHYIRAMNPNFQCIVFIRDDMYRLLLQGTQHSDKFRENVTLKWDAQALESVLTERIRFNYTSNKLTPPVDNLDLFQSVFPKNVGSSGTMNWMTERTLGRPRELIQFAKLYTENLSSPEPDSDIIKSVEESYSRMKIEDLCTEFRNQYPNLKNVFDTWRAKFFRQKYHLTKEEFQHILYALLNGCKIEEKWFIDLKSQTDVDGFAKVLFDIGFVGDFIKGGAGGSRTIYSVEDHTPIFSEIQVHPCFRKAVGTVERIRE